MVPEVTGGGLACVSRSGSLSERPMRYGPAARFFGAAVAEFTVRAANARSVSDRVTPGACRELVADCTLASACFLFQVF